MIIAGTGQSTSFTHRRRGVTHPSGVSEHAEIDDLLELGAAVRQELRDAAAELEVRCYRCERLRGLQLGPFIAQTSWPEGRDRIMFAAGDDEVLFLGNCECGSTVAVEIGVLQAVES